MKKSVNKSVRKSVNKSQEKKEENPPINGISLLPILPNDPPQIVKIKEENNSLYLKMKESQEEVSLWEEGRKELEERILSSSFPQMGIESPLDIGLNMVRYFPEIREEILSEIGSLNKKKRGRKSKGESVSSNPLDIDSINRFFELREEKEVERKSGKKVMVKMGIGSISEILGIKYGHLVKLDEGGFQEIPNRSDSLVDPKFDGRKYKNPLHSFEGGNEKESDEEYQERLKSLKIPQKRIDSLLKSN